MKRRTFKLWHSLLGIAALLVIEGKLVLLDFFGVPFVLGVALLGAAIIIYVATEIVEEVRGTPRMLELLFTVTIKFIAFFAFQYWFLLIAEPSSFMTLGLDWVSLALQSAMVFVFNPLYQPATEAGRALLLINTLSSLGLVLFILQNIWQIRKQS